MNTKMQGGSEALLIVIKQVAHVTWTLAQHQLTSALSSDTNTTTYNIFFISKLQHSM